MISTMFGRWGSSAALNIGAASSGPAISTWKRLSRLNWSSDFAAAMRGSLLSTMIAALHAVRARNPATLVCAVPVASPDSLELVRPLADEVVCLYAPDDFYAVGQFYRTFGQVDDEEAIELLAASSASRPPP